ncbi:MAG: hypothetical protein HQL82_03430 [Magnetococcales bacterium]|nr:hypothetical protein [Magnetococcales bacterium]
MASAADLLKAMITTAIAEDLDIPTPSVAAGRPLVHPDPMVAAKAGLHMALREARISRIELGRQLGWTVSRVEQVLDPRHNSGMKQINQALAALGKRLLVSVQAA